MNKIIQIIHIKKRSILLINNFKNNRIKILAKNRKKLIISMMIKNLTIKFNKIQIIIKAIVNSNNLNNKKLLIIPNKICKYIKSKKKMKNF